MSTQCHRELRVAPSEGVGKCDRPAGGVWEGGCRYPRHHVGRDSGGQLPLHGPRLKIAGPPPPTPHAPPRLPAATNRTPARRIQESRAVDPQALRSCCYSSTVADRHRPLSKRGKSKRLFLLGSGETELKAARSQGKEKNRSAATETEWERGGSGSWERVLRK